MVLSPLGLELRLLFIPYIGEVVGPWSLVMGILLASLASLDELVFS